MNTYVIRVAATLQAAELMYDVEAKSPEEAIEYIKEQVKNGELNAEISQEIISQYRIAENSKVSCKVICEGTVEEFLDNKSN